MQLRAQRRQHPPHRECRLIRLALARSRSVVSFNCVSLYAQFLDPVFGNKNPSFTEFMAPGLILT